MSRTGRDDATIHDISPNMAREIKQPRPVILDDLCEHPVEHVSADGTRCLACGQLFRPAGAPL